MNLSETREVLGAISSLRDNEEQMALATIVSVRGSTYRRPGARLLVPAGGGSVGNLSGGCLEGEVEDLARDVMASGVPRLQTYDLTADDEVVWGWGLGCNGAIEIFVEPAGKAAETADALRAAIDREEPVTVLTVLESTDPSVAAGDRVLVGRGSPEPAGADARAVMHDAARAALDAGTTGVVDLVTPAGSVRAFVESLRPPLMLLVCGAGHDAIPVVRMGAALGWKVVVVDDRSEMLTRERLGDAAELVVCPPGETAQAARVDERTYAVVMSHNYLRDRDYLRSLGPSEAAYLGMLGPRARLERLLRDLEGEGFELDGERLARIHGPAGLDIGAEGPEEIAIAIVSEVLAVSRARAGGFLKERRGPIHARPTAEVSR